METSPGQPIPFIEIHENEDDKNHVLVINPYAINILQEMRDKKIAVLVVSGTPSSGKSLLANRLIDREEGFTLGTFSQKGTDGIWLWSELIKLNPEHDFETLVLDMEGIDLSNWDTLSENDKNLKMKLLTLALLLSSMFLYNSIGPVTDKAFQDISLISKIHKYIDAREAENKEPITDFSSFLPYFIWVLRDFSLNLNGKTPVEYLTSCLMTEEGAATELNETKITLDSYFKDRECHCLVKPLNDENQVKEIAQVPIKKMKPLFTAGINTLKEKLSTHIKPKTVKDKTLTGTMLMNLTFEFIEALNNDRAASIFMSAENVIYAETRKIYENTLIEYYDMADEEFNENKMPFEEEQVNEIFKRHLRDILKKFEDATKDFADVNQLIEFRNNIQDEIESDFQTRMQKSEEMSQHLCKVLINEFFNSFDLSSLFDNKELKESTLIEYKEKFQTFYENYKLFAKGAHKFDILADCLPNFLFEFFEKYVESANKMHGKEINNFKIDSKEKRAKEEILQKKLAELEDRVLDIEKERDEITRQYQKNLKEHNLYVILKEDKEQNALSEIKSLQEKLYKKKEKSRELKRKAKELEELVQKDKHERDLLKRQHASMKDEVKTLEEKVRESYTLRNSNSANELNPQLPGMVEGLFKQMRALKGSIGVSDSSRVSESKSDLEKNEEIAIIKNAFEKKLNENWERLKIMKEEYQKENEKLRKALEEQRNENSQLRVSAIETTKNLESLNKKDQMIDKLQQQVQAMSEEVALKKKDHKVSVEVTEKFKGEVEQTNMKLSDQEGKIAELKSEVNNLKARQFDVVYAVKEAVKKALKKPHYLRNAMETLDEEVADEIRGMFQELGIKIDY